MIPWLILTKHQSLTFKSTAIIKMLVTTQLYKTFPGFFIHPGFAIRGYKDLTLPGFLINNHIING